MRSSMDPRGHRNAGALRQPPDAVSLGIALLVALSLVLTAAAGADQASTGLGSQAPAAQGDSAKAASPVLNLSEAELLIRIRQLIVQDQGRLSSLESGSVQLARDFEAASKRFNRLDSEREAGAWTEKSPAERRILEQRWTFARAELDPLLQRRQAMEQQLKILKRKIEREKEALDVVGNSSRSLPSLAPPATPALAPEPAGTATPEPSPKAPEPNVIVPEGSQTPSKRPATSGVYDRRVADAERELRRREGELQLAERRARLADQLASLNQDDLAQAQALAETSHSLQQLLDDEVAKLENELQASAPTRLRVELESTIAQVRRLATEATATNEDDAKAVASLETRVKNVEAICLSEEKSVSQAEIGVEKARRRLTFLRSPLAPHRVARWLLDTAPRVAAILGVLALLWIAARWLTRLAVQRLVAVKRYGSEEDRAERVETLRRVLQSILSIGFAVVGVLVVLSEFGVDVTVVLGGAAVFSLAIAFGAQSLVKDYFSGFIILMEDQYRVGNVVQISDKQGVVEDISLRMTTLRDLEGIVHIVPHGQITAVSNLTHGWSQVMLDIGVAYKENVDYVMKVLMDLAREMCEDPRFGPLILADPEMLGVDAFADSAVIIKFVMRTRPLKQWNVKRELLRRIKNRFDELGIEIPFPHRTLYHHGLEQPISVSTGPDPTSLQTEGPVSG
jgi:small-conductance mechanosensitive channel